MGIQKYIGRVKEKGRSERRHSSFYIGLYSHAWVNFYGDFQDCIVSLMKLSPNKRPYYLRGLGLWSLLCLHCSLRCHPVRMRGPFKGRCQPQQ